MRFAGNDQNIADAIFLQATTYVAGFIKSGLGANANFGEQVSRSSSDKALGKGNFCAAEGEMVLSTSSNTRWLTPERSNESACQ